ncbi:DUF6493 family protein [Streptomyces sp. NPDC047000]|uniref:DUF6493 family protein n=1 Tax=Streptomyces sp. NPDC047000 TaxID=3155474 RepID=UPI0033CF04EB
MSALMTAVRAGRTGETVDLLARMTDAERRAHVPELLELRKELRKAPWNAYSRRAYSALHVAGTACRTGAAAVATWIAANDMRWSSAPPAAILRLLADRPADWLADVTDRLARRPPATEVPYELMAGLVRLSGCPVPTTEAYVTGWVEHTGRTWQRGSLDERLRTDAYRAPLVAALFETDDIGSRLERSAGGEQDTWPGALARLTAEGALDRKAMVDGCLARLLRGGTPADARVFLLLLRLLDPTPEERREHTADWLALAADAVSPVAGHAQSVLAALTLDGGLSARQLAEMSGAVLFRPEKKLVRAQLVLLGKALARDRTAADELLPGVAQAFGHTDPDIQERALTLVERHLTSAGDAGTRDELSAMAEQLIPELRARAAGLLGTRAAGAGAEPEPYEENLPPFTGPVRLAAAPATPEETAEEVSAALASAPSVAEFERTLDGLVRHAYHDRDALVRALRPVLARCWWNDDGARAQDSVERVFDPTRGWLFTASSGLELLLVTLYDRIRTRTLHAAVHHGTACRDCGHAALTRAFDARLWEVAYLLRTRPVPFLLSVPTWSTGLLEPDELVDRLDTYRRLGARAGEADFAQALLRVRRGDRASAQAAAGRAAALGTPEGARLARWLTAGVRALRTTRRTHPPRILVEFGELTELQEDFPAAFRPLGRPTGVLGNFRYCFHGGPGAQRHWPALLPERRELVAGRLLPGLSELAVGNGRGDGAYLPLLAESDGEAGEAMHLGLAYGLCARHPEDRLAAVDALLTLAARGQLDPVRLGTDLRQLVQAGAAKPLRLAESARTAAATGACATVWEVLRHVLPALLAGPSAAGAAPARGLGDLLGVAAECVERSGAGGEVRYLTETADRRGSSQLLTQARRLRAALAFAAAA